MIKKLYKKTKDLNYLAQSAIYKFESYPEKKPNALIKESVKDLGAVTAKIQNDVYDNYLGYLLIDYDIDVSRGVELVKRALTKDPTSIFYKDSLAWAISSIVQMPIFDRRSTVPRPTRQKSVSGLCFQSFSR